MASYTTSPLNMATLPSTVTSTVGANMSGGAPSTPKVNIVRVIAVNPTDGSILYETIKNNIGPSYLGKPQPMPAKLLNNTVSSIPRVGELVEVIPGPTIQIAEGKAQAPSEMYYKPAPIDVWQNQNNNIILDPTVQGQANEDPMANLSLGNYQNALNGFAPGFVPPNESGRSYSNSYIPYNGMYIPFTQTITDANAQKQWLLNYLKSPMYLDRLKKEFPGKDEAFVKAEQNKRIQNLQTSQIQVVKQIESSPGLAAGVTIQKNIPKNTFYYSYKTKKWVLITDVKDPKFKSGVAYIEKVQNTGWEGIVTHELSHVTDDVGNLIPQSTITKIHNYTGGGDVSFPSRKIGNLTFDYYSTPTEFIARLNVIRYLLNQQGIYDAKSRAFTAQDYDKMLKDPTIKNNTATSEIFRVLIGNDAEKKRKFIDMMNTVAYNEPDNSVFSRTG